MRQYIKPIKVNGITVGYKWRINILGGKKMDVKEFFEKAKAICEHYSDEECPYCPLDEFCDAGIFAMNSEKAESVIDIVKGFDLTQLN